MNSNDLIHINTTIITMIVSLYIIDYYHKQYRIKLSKKNFSYRNSHSFYDNTDYTKYKPYKEIHTYKILIKILFIILLISFIFNPKKFFLSLADYFIPNNPIDIIILTIINILIYKYYLKSNKNSKLSLSEILVYLIFLFVLLNLSSIIYK